MSSEAIIKQIQKDAEKEIKKIQKDAQNKIDEIEKNINKQIKEQEELILSNGKKEAENIKKIRISQAHQEAKRELMNAKETIIENCFEKAKQKLIDIDENRYRQIIQNLIDNGSKQIKGSFSIQTSKPLDKIIAEEKNIPVSGTIHASGGIKLVSEDGKITVDNTFEGILKRRKEEIRVKVGKMLFS